MAGERNLGADREQYLRELGRPEGGPGVSCRLSWDAGARLSWDACAVSRVTCVFLSSITYGKMNSLSVYRKCICILYIQVPFNVHERLHERWGVREAARIVQTEPYRLTTELALAFRIADRIARGLCNLEPGRASGAWERWQHSRARYGAASVHVLRAAERNGHCCLPASKLQTETAELLQLAEQHAERRRAPSEQQIHEPVCA